MFAQYNERNATAKNNLLEIFTPQNVKTSLSKNQKMVDTNLIVGRLENGNHLRHHRIPIGNGKRVRHGGGVRIEHVD